MNNNRPIVRISLLSVLLIGISAIGCKFSFADSKRPSRGSLTFGAEQKPSIEAAAGLQAFKTVFADVAEKVVPTVVSVIPTKIDTVVYQNVNPFYRFFGGDPHSGSPFGRFHGPQQQPPMQMQERRQQGLGSGVIVSKEGYVLTNSHVVAGADEIEVKLSDGRVFDAQIIGTDSLTDVAVIKIEENVEDLPVAYLGDSEKLRAGEWVIAIGNPFNFQSTVTAGIVSALGRNMATVTGVQQNQYQSLIQTDAAINPGNSGGALVNIDGELVGINTMIYTRSGGYMGIGLAIPINMAQWIMEDLIYEGKVSRGFLGVGIQELKPATRDAMGLDSKTIGVLIGQVMDGYPAKKAGIRSGDIIVSVDGRVVRDPNELRNVVAATDPGKKVEIVVIRGGKKIKLTATLTSRDEKELASADGGDEEQGEEEAESDMSEKLGIEVSTLNKELRGRIGIGEDVVGVAITKLDPKSQAAQEGLREGDVIKEVRVKGRAAQKTPTVKAFKAAVRKLKPADAIMFLVQRGEGTSYVAYRFKPAK